MNEEIEIIESNNQVTMKCSLEQFVQLFGLTLDEYKQDYSSIKELVDRISEI